MDESDNPHAVTLVSGYELAQDAPPSLGSGRLYRSVRDADALPVGQAHAVRRGEQDSVCGKTMRKVTDTPWPPGMGSRCRDCQEALS